MARGCYVAIVLIEQLIQVIRGTPNGGVVSAARKRI